MTGTERVGGCCLFVPDGVLNNEKIKKKNIVALDGRDQ